MNKTKTNFLMHELRDRRQISILILSEIERIN